MNRTTFYLLVLSLAIIGLPLPPNSAAAGEKIQVRHTTVAASGSPTPAGGTYLPLFFSARLNARHEVTFDGVVNGPPVTTGVFVGNGRTASTIVLGTNPDPAGPSFGFVGNPFITQTGDVVFQANASDIFTSNTRTIVPLVRSGDDAPGGGILTLTGTFAANGRGAIVYGAGISGSTASRGIFRTDGPETVAIVRDDHRAPTGGRFTSLLGRPVINDRGQVTFFAQIIGGPADFGVFRAEGKDLTTVFAANLTAPGGATFADFGDPLINNHGYVAAFASLTNGPSRGGLFIGDGTDAVTIALQGETAPKGGRYREQDAFGALRLNDRGEVAFVARLTGGSSSGGIFRGNGGRATTIALAGTTAPGTLGTFQSFDHIELGIDGTVAFIATLEIGVGGVDASNNRGIWVGTSDEDLHLVVRTGDIIGDNVLTRLPTFDQDNQFDMNQNGIMWVGSLGPTTVIVVSHVFRGIGAADERS